ncbi:MAG TPA: arsenate reductase (glutaredoxin) [Allosphingosinicella sp.]
MKATIWHNPRCGTSRNALALLDEAGADVTIVEYLRDPPSPDELKRVYARAGLTPRQGLRAKEPAAQDLANATDAEIIDAMMLNPVLIERPLVETEQGALLARPAERVREIL